MLVFPSFLDSHLAPFVPVKCFAMSLLGIESALVAVSFQLSVYSRYMNSDGFGYLDLGVVTFKRVYI